MQKRPSEQTIVQAGNCLLAILLSFAGYNAYLFIDSNTFCGKLDHSVILPGYTACLMVRKGNS